MYIYSQGIPSGMEKKDNSVSSIPDQVFESYGVTVTVPGKFFVMMKQQMFIRLGGLFYAVSQLGTYSLKTELVHDEPDNIVMKGTGKFYPNAKVKEWFGIPNDHAFSFEPITAYGTATKFNNNVKQYPYEMADTRATARVLRKITGCAFTAVEEMGPDEKEVKKEAVQVPPGVLKKASDLSVSKRDKYLMAVEKLMKKDPETIEPRVKAYLESKDLNVIANCDETQAEELYQAPADADDRVDLGDLFEYLVLVPFGEAPRHDDRFEVAVLFEPRDVEDVVYRLFLRALDERARVDYDDVGFRFVGRDLVPRRRKTREHRFRIDEILCASERNEPDLFGFIHLYNFLLYFGIKFENPRGCLIYPRLNVVPSFVSTSVMPFEASSARMASARA